MVKNALSYKTLQAFGLLLKQTPCYAHDAVHMCKLLCERL